VPCGGMGVLLLLSYSALTLHTTQRQEVGDGSNHMQEGCRLWW
jgi:hypothetical protein